MLAAAHVFLVDGATKHAGFRQIAVTFVPSAHLRWRHSMLDTRLSDDFTLRCEALLDRVAATPVGPNAHALKVALAECDAIERAIADPSAICRVRDARHWLRLAYGQTLHAYPPDQVRENLLRVLGDLVATLRTQGT
jgi:hypothetical protein